MPQLNKGAFCIFGFSVIHADLTIHLPPQALPENHEMSNIADNWLFHMILLFTIIGEFFLPWILERFYVEYNGRIMVMGALGSSQSSVRLVYNLWIVWFGGFSSFTAAAYFLSLRVKFPVLAFFMLLSIGIFAVGAGLIPASNEENSHACMDI